jgi:hypothetical protein
MQVFFAIGYFVMGFVQFFAVIDGIQYALNLGRFVSVVLAFFITYILWSAPLSACTARSKYGTGVFCKRAFYFFGTFQSSF